MAFTEKDKEALSEATDIFHGDYWELLEDLLENNKIDDKEYQKRKDDFNEILDFLDDYLD